jgi:hypothetical protein
VVIIVQFKNDEMQQTFAWNVNDCKDNPYVAGILRYAEQWADLMEVRLAENPELTVADIAEKTSHEADTEGITGYMYNCAIRILAGVWEHGEDLRRWHNLDVCPGEKGEQANRDGGVFNSAVLVYNG